MRADSTLFVIDHEISGIKYYMIALFVKRQDEGRRTVAQKNMQLLVFVILPLVI